MNNGIENRPTTAQEKGAAFLEWISDNERELKKAVRKNITFDPELFDDVFAEAIINVYNTITANNSEIKNLKNYFFLAFKWQYQMRQNQWRKRRDASVRGIVHNLDVYDEVEDEQAKDTDITEAIKAMREVLTEQFGKRNTEIFFTYWTDKVKASTSYDKIGASYGLTADEVGRILVAMRKYVTEEMKYIKEIFTTDYAYDS